MEVFANSWPSFLRSKTISGAYLKSLFLWNPITCLLFTLSFGGFENFGGRLFVSLIIANLVMNFSFAVVLLARLLVRATSRQGAAHPLLKSRKWSLSVSLLAMPAGLYFSFYIVDSLRLFVRLAGSPAKLDDYRFGLLIGTLIAALHFFASTWSEAKHAVQHATSKLKTAENEKLHAQLSALSAQMNPHLLFNALNSVASLIPVDPAKAEATLLQLSQLYRSVLSSSRDLVHPLAKELEICRNYLEIEKLRFGERLRFEFEIDDLLNLHEIPIPALSLQTLVENSVKHGISPRAIGGEILIKASRLENGVRVGVEDDGVGLKIASSSRNTGFGLHNCRERLKLHFGSQAMFEVIDRQIGGTSATIFLPLMPEVTL